MSKARRAILATATVLAAGLVAGAAAVPASASNDGPRDVYPSLRDDLVAYYDFDHPVKGDPALERDLGRSGTEIELVNGGDAMRVRERAFKHSGNAIQTRQVNPAT